MKHIPFLILSLSLTACNQSSNHKEVESSIVTETNYSDSGIAITYKTELETNSNFYAHKKEFIRHLNNYPQIVDSSTFMTDLVGYYNLSTEFTQADEGKVNSFQKVNFYGSDKDYYLIEYDYKEGCLANYPWKYQLIISPNGDLLHIVNAERFELIHLFENENPFLLTTNVTAKGNGDHNLYQISSDTILNVLNSNVRTIDRHQDEFIYEPAELEIQLVDLNNDGFKDIKFSGLKVAIKAFTKDGFFYDRDIINGDTIEYSTDNPFNKTSLEYNFIFDKKLKQFYLKE